MKKVTALLVMMAVCVSAVMTGADSVNRMEAVRQALVSAAEIRYDGWRATHAHSFVSGGMEHFVLLLMAEENRMLKTREIYVSGEKLSAERISEAEWSMTELAPIPLTAAGAERMRTVIAGTDTPGRKDSCVDRFLRENAMLGECIPPETGEGETVRQIFPYPGYLLWIAENEAGKQSLRIADWDGTDYGAVTASRWQKELSYNDYHSGEDFMEVFSASGQEYLERDGQGIWRLVQHDPIDDFRYAIIAEGLLDTQAAEFEPYRNNDAWHYGTPTFALTFPEIDFDSVPDFYGAVALLDAGDWACVRQEGAAMYDVPDGTVRGNCFQRLPGRVLSRNEQWTQLQIGSRELGTAGWFHTQDLAFGGETEQVVCTFPTYDYWALIESEEGRSIPEYKPVWLIGRQPDGAWITLIDCDTVKNIPEAVIGETHPTEHEWEENSWYYNE